MHQTIIKKINELSAKEQHRMFFLMDKHYENMNKNIFTRDLNEKDGVMILADTEGQIEGFSTYKLIKTRINKKNIIVVFTGDTIMNKEQWGKLGPLKIFGIFLNNIMGEYPDIDKYWYLLSKGYRTYLMMCLFFKDYFPGQGRTIPDFEKELMIQISLDRYNKDKLINKNGVLILNLSSDYLKGEFSEIPDKRKQDPNVLFFLDNNRNYQKGDELVCLAKISKDNFTTTALRFLK